MCFPFSESSQFVDPHLIHVLSQNQENERKHKTKANKV